MYVKSRKRYRLRYMRHKKNKQFKLLILALLLAAVFVGFSINRRNTEIPIENVSAFKIPSDNLFELIDLSSKYSLDFSEVLTLYSLENDFYSRQPLTSAQELILNYNDIKNKYISRKYNGYFALLEGIINEIKAFPVNTNAQEYIYGDSWGAERTYGGKRIHMGCDIMDRDNIRARLEIVSMTDGIIENIGWNEKGGWRVGIRSSGGNYYYYAHLDSFAEGLTTGTAVSAGTLLGKMGDSGYGRSGTKGKFEVHLHLGISPVTTLSRNELWINPYPFLRYVDKCLKIEGE